MEENFSPLPGEARHYNVLKENPKALLSYVDKFVNIQLVKNCSYSGFVHTIDPTSHSIIISVPRDNSYQTILLPGDAITDIAVIIPDSKIFPPIKKKTAENCPMTAEEQIQKKKKIIGWLEHNLLPVSEEGNDIILGSASLIPPYTVNNILCFDNPFIQLQLKALLQSMPEDFEPKSL